MSLPKLTYFDFPSSRGEECRLAFHVAGVAFEDNRIAVSDWPALKPTTPFGSLPVLEVPGKPMLAQSNAILTLIGRKHGLHPEDAFEAARHEAMMMYAEEMRVTVSPTTRMSDEAAKKTAREALAENYLPKWGALAEQQVALKAAPFFGGEMLNVVDIKLYIAVRWFASGSLDHIPKTIFTPFPKLTALYEAVRDDARIKAWYAKSA